MKKLLLPAFALLLALPLSALQTQAGVQAALVFPQNDLRGNVDGTMGLTFGVHVNLNLQGGSELRPRLDYLQCDTEALHVLTLSTTTRSVHAVALGADYLRFVDGGSRGLYGLVGTGMQWWSASEPSFGNTSETAPYLKFGAGFRFDSAVSAEITYDLGRFRSTSGTAGSIQAGLSYTF